MSTEGVLTTTQQYLMNYSNSKDNETFNPITRRELIDYNCYCCPMAFTARHPGVWLHTI